MHYRATGDNLVQWMLQWLKLSAESSYKDPGVEFRGLRIKVHRLNYRESLGTALIPKNETRGQIDS
jgi:hypothetical protein